MLFKKEFACSCFPQVCQINAVITFFIVKVLELSDGKVLKSWEAYRTSVQHCRFTPDCQTLVSSAHDSVIQVWEIFKKIMLFKTEGFCTIYNVNSVNDYCVLCCSIQEQGTVESVAFIYAFCDNEYYRFFIFTAVDDRKALRRVKETLVVKQGDPAILK